MYASCSTSRPLCYTSWEGTLRQMQADINGLVNQYFKKRLLAIPQVREYMEALA